MIILIENHLRMNKTILNQNLLKILYIMILIQLYYKEIKEIKMKNHLIITKMLN